MTTAGDNGSHTRKKRRVYDTPVRRKKPGLLTRLLQHLPAWAWWVGGAAVVIGYVLAFYYFFVGPFGFRWRALYGDVSYPEGYEIHGIDVSHYQGYIDWADLRSNGMIDKYPIRFVMIKATEGSRHVDERFAYNFAEAREHGFICGAYHFWSIYSPGKEQAEHFISTVELRQGDLPPVLDVEHKAKDQSVEDFQKSVKQWLDIVEEHYGVKPIIYTYYKFKTSLLDDPMFDQYPYWIAHYYVDSVNYKGDWKFWQHTDCGKLPGIDGYVDFDIYNGSYYDLQRLTIGGNDGEADDDVI